MAKMWLSHLRHWDRPLTGWARGLVLVTALGLATLLGIARWLEPSATGFGTHQGLGLPRCTIVELFGVRCPSCGMTTAWANLVRGHIGWSLQANVGGCVLAALALLVTPWLGVSCCAGRWWLTSPKEWVGLVIAGSLFVITLADWSVRFFCR